MHDPGRTEQGYVPTATLISDRGRAFEVVTREFARVSSIIERSRDIADALGLAVELEQMLENIRHFVDTAKSRAA